MGPAVLEDLTESDPQVILWDQPALSLQTPLGLVLWTAMMANWNPRNAVKFRDTPPPPTWNIYLLQWMCILVQWYDNPFPTLPGAEVKELHAALGSMKDTGILQHPR